ncbi:MAG: hypothetical protein KI786_06910, partial [Mameliella sp.]|nr:hypothetical protein [Phaeodactylibacter sp.]
LTKTRQEGKKALQKLFKELRQYGYADLKALRNEDGSFFGKIYVIREIPLNAGQRQHGEAFKQIPGYQEQANMEQSLTKSSNSHRKTQKGVVGATERPFSGKSVKPKVRKTDRPEKGLCNRKETLLEKNSNKKDSLLEKEEREDFEKIENIQPPKQQNNPNTFHSAPGNIVDRYCKDHGVSMISLPYHVATRWIKMLKFMQERNHKLDGTEPAVKRDAIRELAKFYRELRLQGEPIGTLEAHFGWKIEKGQSDDIIPPGIALDLPLPAEWDNYLSGTIFAIRKLINARNKGNTAPAQRNHSTATGSLPESRQYKPTKKDIERIKRLRKRRLELLDSKKPVEHA